MSDQVSPFEEDGLRPRPEAEIAELSPETGVKLLLSSLPPSLSAVLSRLEFFCRNLPFSVLMELTLNLNRLDLNGDGFVDVDEVKDCLFTVDSIEKGRIPIRALPADVQVLPALCA